MDPANNPANNPSNSGNKVSISRFNRYVNRMVALPDGVEPAKITTGIIVRKTSPGQRWQSSLKDFYKNPV